MKCVIGIDGGGTKTLLRMTDLNKNILVEETGGLSNICSSDQATVEENMRELFSKAFKKAPQGIEIEAVCIGSAGVVAKENVEFFKVFLNQLTGCHNIIVHVDAYVALYANLGNQPGVSITAGTGSICCGKNRNGNYWRVGGWGHIFSDEGSAYAITVAALCAISRSHDGREEPTALSDLMLERLGVASVEDMVAKIYMTDSDKTTLAGLSRIVDVAAAKGDRAAINILENAAVDLYGMCDAVINRLSLSEDVFTVVKNGGVLNHSQWVGDSFIKLMKKNYPKSVVTKAENDAAWGSIFLALDSLSPKKG